MSMTRESMLKLVDFFEENYHTFTIESIKRSLPLRLERGRKASYLVKIPTTTYVDKQIVNTLRSYIRDAGLDEEHVYWRIEGDEIIFGGTYKEAYKLDIPSKATQEKNAAKQEVMHIQH